MKKFSMNLLKVMLLLIVGVCMIGAVSHVEAVKKEKVDNLIVEEEIELKIGETKNVNYDMKFTNYGGQTGVKFNDYIVSLEELEKCEGLTYSRNTEIVTVDNNSGKAKGVVSGKTKIVYEIGVRVNNEIIIFYDEVDVVVLDENNERPGWFSIFLANLIEWIYVTIFGKSII